MKKKKAKTNSITGRAMGKVTPHSSSGYSMATDMTRHRGALLEMRRVLTTRAMHGHKESDTWALIQHRKLVQVFSSKAMLETVKCKSLLQQVLSAIFVCFPVSLLLISYVCPIQSLME